MDEIVGGRVVQIIAGGGGGQVVGIDIVVVQIIGGGHVVGSDVVVVQIIGGGHVVGIDVVVVQIIGGGHVVGTNVVHSGQITSGVGTGLVHPIIGGQEQLTSGTDASSHKVLMFPSV